jgi:surface antigen
MRALRTGTKTWLLSSALLFSSTLFAADAEAAHSRPGRTTIRPTASFHVHQISTRMTFASGARFSHAMHMGSRQFAARSYGISCVPYAREVSGILVAGNAWQWWDNAEGLYARGDRPEAGSVLNFRANFRMRLGHVAVVTQVVNSREVIVDHANWPSGGGPGGVSHDVTVVDVSEANNWSAVRVELGRGGEFGSVYPTYGFIYNRPDTGYVTASIARPAPQPAINRVPSDLRPTAERPWHTVEEVAEAPANSPRRIDLSIPLTAASPEQ